MGTTGQSITLANSIIGVGILAMPFCYQQCGVVLATLILLLMGLVSRLCCYFLIKSALIARRRNFEFLAFHVFGPAGKLAVEVGIIGFLMGTCIAYFVVVGDLGPQIVAKMFNINQSDILRTSIMVIVSLVCVLPLGLLRNVDSLSNVSAATICFYFCLVTKVIAEAASQLLVGDWHTKLHMWRPEGMLQCVPIFSMALFCQTQLFEIFESLPSLSLEKMNVVTKNAINICTGVYFTLGLFGYIAFCTHDISGNILMSLSPTMASDVIKLGFVMSLAFSFPLIIFPCRASLYSFLFRKGHQSHHDHIINHSIPERTFRCITIAIVAVALCVSLLIPNIELVLGLVGSTIGVIVCVLFPAACFVNLTFKNTNERVLAKGVLILGLVIMVLGTYANLQAAENKLDRYEDKYITQERIDKIVQDFFDKREKDSDGVIIKPAIKSASVLEDKIINIKESEIQPPNPVPPESQSNEKNPMAIVEDVNKLKVLKEIPDDKYIDKISVSHPKNLKTKLQEAKLANGVNNDDKNNVENPPTVEKAKAPVEDNSVIKKQQQLMETIKQHGEEQKELMKEQQKILDEILKTKEEMRQDKQEKETNEAKKIAVESIQKIANMAIQSLSGVSEKPVGQEVNNKDEPLEKLANEAVQEIAKKAVETIEAIQEINIKLKEEPVQSSVNNNIGNANVDAQNLQPINNFVNLPEKQNLKHNVENVETVQQSSIHMDNQNKNLVPQPVQNANVQQPAQNVPQPQLVQHNAAPVVQNVNNANSPHDNIPSELKQHVELPASNDNQELQHKVESDNANAEHDNNGQVQNLNNPEIPAQNDKNINAHSHSPDEPQSYKEGEDTQKKIFDVNNNMPSPDVPLALALNNDIYNKREQQNNAVENDHNNKKAIVNTNIGDVNGNNEIKPIINEPAVRQKREVVDCTKKLTLSTVDKDICDKLVFKEITDDILPSVDLNDVALPNKIPVHNILMRSLKSYDETDRER